MDILTTPQTDQFSPGNISGYNTTSTENLTDYIKITDFLEYQIYSGINQHKFYILMVLSLLGNGLSLLVLRKRMRQSSPCFYLVNLGVWDTVVTIEKGAYLIGVRYFPEHFGDVGCRLGTFMIFFAIVYSRWIVVAMTIERWIAVAYPLKAASLCTVRRAKLTLLVLAVVVLLAYTQYLVIIEFTPKAPYCIYVSNYTSYVKLVWSWVHMSIYGYAPLMLICVFNALIVCKLVNTQRENSSLQTLSLDETRKRKLTASSVTVMLVVVSVSFLVLTLPYTIYYILTVVFTEKASDAHSEAKDLLIAASLILIADLNHCLNFLLYFVSGKTFRHDLKKLFCSRSSEDANGNNKVTVNSVSQITHM